MTMHADKSIATPRMQRIRGTDAALALVATVGTVAYAMSFAVVAPPEARIAEVAGALGWAAAVSWLGLGVVLAASDGPSALIWSRFRVCLRTMAVGIAILSCGTALNLSPATGLLSIDSLVAIHGAIVVTSNVAMGLFFRRRAGQLGITTFQAMSLWVLVLNGLFVCTMAWLWPYAGVVR